MSWLDTLDDIRKRDFAEAKPSERDKAARDVINLASYACAVVSVSPIPFSDAVLMLPIQSAMVMTVGHIYGRRVTKKDAGQILTELGAAAGVGLVARQGIKALLPVVGALLTIPAAFAANWAIGRVAVEYFRSPGQGPEQLRKLYAAAKAEGESLFSPKKFEWFRRRGTAAGDAAKADTSSAPEGAKAPRPKRAKATGAASRGAGSKPRSRRPADRDEAKRR